MRRETSRQLPDDFELPYRIFLRGGPFDGDEITADTCGTYYERCVLTDRGGLFTGRSEYSRAKYAYAEYFRGDAGEHCFVAEFVCFDPPIKSYLRKNGPGDYVRVYV